MSRSSQFVLIVGCLVASLLAIHGPASADALLLGSFIGCNSFGCRISALESDVAQLKQQMARLDPSGQMQGMNNFQRPNLPFNQNMNNMNPQQQQQMQNGQQQNNGQNNGQGAQTTNNQRQGGGGGQVSYALDYPIANGQNLRRNPNYPNDINNGINNGLNNGQFINM